MSSYFTDVPTRPNAGTFQAAWVNALRTAGISLEAILNAVVGGGIVTETNQAIANNQSSAASITALALSSSYKKHIVEYVVKRIATATVIEGGTLIVLYDGTNWTCDKAIYVGDAGIDFTVTSGGQVQYTSDNMAGSYDTDNSIIQFTSKTQGA